MTPQDLINQIAALPYNGQVHVVARDAFLKQFPLSSIPKLSKDQYIQTGNKNTFCYNLEFVRDLPFGIGGQSDKKFGKASNPGFPKVQGISDMISDASNGVISGLQSKHNLGDISVVVLIKILSIYLPDKFLPIGQAYTLRLLAKVLGISQPQTDLIELNYLCNQELLRLNPAFNGYAYNQIGAAIWQILSPINSSGFEDWLKDNKAENSGAVNAYVRSIERLSLFYGENYYSPEVKMKDLDTLYDETMLHQKDNGGKYYYPSPSYGNKYYYSAAVNSYRNYIQSLVGGSGIPSRTVSSSTSSVQTIVYPKNIILYGPPGTGKTYNTIRYAVSIIKNLDVSIFANSDSYLDNNGLSVNVKDTYDNLVNNGQIVFTTFQQSLSYEDFIEGIKPETTKKKDNVLYEVKPGILQLICEKAQEHAEDNYVLIIDEINRGNVASIFGELITLIEDDKREGKPNAVQCTLPYSKKPFCVPDNLYIIGTMNTADRSVEALDSALRRRFDFVAMMPNSAKVAFRKDVIERINNRLRILKDAEHQLGHSYFMNVSNDEELCVVFHNKVIPLIQEYFYGDMEKIRLVIGDGFCERETVSETLFPNNTSDIDIPTESWRLWDENKWMDCKSDITVFTNAINKLMNG